MEPNWKVVVEQEKLSEEIVGELLLERIQAVIAKPLEVLLNALTFCLTAVGEGNRFRQVTNPGLHHLELIFYLRGFCCHGLDVRHPIGSHQEMCCKKQHKLECWK